MRWRWNAIAVLAAAAVTFGLGFWLNLLPGLPEFGDRRIGVVYPIQLADDHFADGARLAAEELNARGGILRRKVVLQIVPENIPEALSSRNTAINVAMKEADRLALAPDILAVIGHGSSLSAVPASSIYWRNDTLFMSTYATNTSLTSHAYDNVFSLIPNDALNGQALARYIVRRNFKNVILLGDRTVRGDQTLRYLAEEARNHDIQVAYRGVLDARSIDTEDVVMRLLNDRSSEFGAVDAIVVVTSFPQISGAFIKMARRLGVKTPIVGTNLMASPTTIAVAGQEAMQGVVAVTPFDESHLQSRLGAFYGRFQARFGRPPTSWSAIGYDAVMLLANAAELSGKWDFRPIADTLHDMRYLKTGPYKGLAANYAFSRSGQVVTGPLFCLVYGPHGFQLVDTIESASLPQASTRPDVNNPSNPNKPNEEKTMLGPTIFVAWALLSFLVGWLGRRRKLRFFGNFLVSIVLSPVVGLVVLAASDPRPKPVKKKPTDGPPCNP